MTAPPWPIIFRKVRVTISGQKEAGEGAQPGQV